MRKFLEQPLSGRCVLEGEEDDEEVVRAPWMEECRAPEGVE